MLKYFKNIYISPTILTATNLLSYYTQIVLRLPTVSSNPCSNNKKSTPKSAILSISFRSLNIPNPAGPIISPATRKPMTGDAFSHLNNGTIP